jgi:hypothetical protein
MQHDFLLSLGLIDLPENQKIFMAALPFSHRRDRFAEPITSSEA